MVCPRCVMAVEQTLSKLNIPYTEVVLGMATVDAENIDLDKLDEELKAIGFELIRDEKKVLVEQIKTLIINLVHHSDNQELKENLSDYISSELNKEYSFLSKLFSDNEGVSIEKYYILQKIERVKELITYGELTFSEIAYQLNYSSPAHLSKQFKDITGKTLSEYKNAKKQNRQTLDRI